MRATWPILSCLLALVLAEVEVKAQIAGVDTGIRAQALVQYEPQLLRDWGRTRPWIRLRGHPIEEKQAVLIRREVEAMHQLLDLDFNLIVLLRWDTKSWESGVRAGGGQRLPLDLFEIYRRGYFHGRTYGFRTAFEIENEPDISFVQDNAETYAAFLKAAYLGLKAGAAKGVEQDALGSPQTSPSGERGTSTSLIYRKWPGHRSGAWTPLIYNHCTVHTQSPHQATPPRVIMAPLALPPGPYLERLTANGLFSYTDAFNYHYYGYAEDFSGVYHQFEQAVLELMSAEKKSMEAGLSGRFQMDFSIRRKALPVLLTEYGYGSLAGDAAGSVEGRVHQWRWFKSVGEQILKLRPMGPMAFYLPPYFENKSMEFGLTVPKGLPQPEGIDFSAGGLPYRPVDFALAKTTRWMERIGQGFGGNEATPALAWLLEEGIRKPYRPRDWTVWAPTASPVVMDFIAGAGLVQQKRYGGYVVIADPDATGMTAGTQLRLNAHAIRSGRGQLVLYNFSEQTLHGQLVATRGRMLLADPAGVERDWTLPPMERVVIPLALTVPADAFVRHELVLHFSTGGAASQALLPPSAAGSRRLISVFSSLFYPDAAGLKEIMRYDFWAEKENRAKGRSAQRNQALLAKRPLATEEPRLLEERGWSVTRGVTVGEPAKGVWRFRIAAFPAEANKPAMAELALPDDFSFPDGDMMRFDYRLVEPAGTTIANGKYFEAYFRTANGNLYQVWPRQYAMATWSEYTEVKENYTMAFYGRANLPWRFRDNRPVALVFFFRPGQASLPAVYEIKNARIVKFQGPTGN